MIKPNVLQSYAEYLEQNPGHYISALGKVVSLYSDELAEYSKDKDPESEVDFTNPVFLDVKESLELVADFPITESTIPALAGVSELSNNLNNDFHKGVLLPYFMMISSTLNKTLNEAEAIEMLHKIAKTVGARREMFLLKFVKDVTLIPSTSDDLVEAIRKGIGYNWIEEILDGYDFNPGKVTVLLRKLEEQKAGIA